MLGAPVSASHRTVEATSAIEDTRLAAPTDRHVALEETLASVTDMGSLPGSKPRHPELAPGELVSRYVIVSRLGAGAMGVVYAAYDPELDRKVALKLVRPNAAIGGGASEGPARLLREAQALAKLNHPAVVSIHDVGTFGEQVWISMEFVEGETLTDWVAAAPRSWREIVEVMRAAGRGLAAAHEAGLLHRDFKPDNVMLGVDGRVRVMDFGLARARDPSRAPTMTNAGASSSAASASSSGRAMTASVHARLRSTSESAGLSVELTQAGALLGTPAYMAPEQFTGADITAAVDQFAFCVTLWELLYGERPFAGESVIELSVAVADGIRRAPPRHKQVPAWLQRVCERGLAVQPSRRYPSIVALLEALDAGQRGASRRRALVAAATVAAIGVGAFAYYQYDLSQKTARCESTRDGLSALWTDSARARMREALLATEISYAATTAEKVMPWLDAYARDWGDARVESCLNAERRETWSPDTYARARWCLEERALAFEALVEEFSQGDGRRVENAVSAAVDLPRIEPCRRAELLTRLGTPPPPTALRGELSATRAQLSEASAREAAGEYESGLQLAESALARAQATSWRPLIAAARVEVGVLREQTGDYDGAVEQLRAAYFEAAKSGANETATNAALALVGVLGYQKARHEDSLLWGELLELELDRLGAEQDDLRRAALKAGLAIAQRGVGDYRAAIELNQAALETYERALGPEHPTVAVNLSGLANSHHFLGDYERARELYQRALEIKELTLGPDHPEIAVFLNNLGIVHMDTGQHHKALPLSERALEIREAALGPDHPYVAHSLTSLGILHFRAGDYARALALYERTRAIMEKAFGPDHPNTAHALNNLAMTHFERGDLETARPLLERALAIRESALGPDHPSVAINLHNIARVHLRAGELDRAEPMFARALAIREKALGPDHPRVAETLTEQAELALALARREDARALAERALGILEGKSSPPETLAQTRFALARALWPNDQVRARALADAAQEGYADVGGKASARDEVARWLAERDAE